MKLARVHGPRDLRLDDVQMPVPGPLDVVVRVQACGICGSDLAYVEQGGLGGPLPLTSPLPIGHEFAGVVEEVGIEVQGVQRGMRVAVNPDDSFIGGGGTEGAMAPFILIPKARIGSNLYPVPDHVPMETAALAEPISVAIHGINLAHIGPGAMVAVLGAGPIGLSAVAVLRNRGITNIAVFDRVDSRLKRARKLGATLAVNVTERCLGDALAEAHGSGERFGTKFVQTDVFIDTAGSGDALSEVIRVAKFRSRIVIIALYKKPWPIDLWKMMANEIALTGSIALNRHAEFAEALAMMESGAVDIGPLISHRIDFDQCIQAFQIAADAGQSAKVMLTFPGFKA